MSFGATGTPFPTYMLYITNDKSWDQAGNDIYIYNAFMFIKKGHGELLIDQQIIYIFKLGINKS